MATKSTGWTARRQSDFLPRQDRGAAPTDDTDDTFSISDKRGSLISRNVVKICCVILIPILLFISMCGTFSLMKMEDVSFKLLFINLSNNDYFYDNKIPSALYNAHSLFWLQSEENIRDMGCLEWQLEYPNNGFARQYVLASTNPANQWVWGAVPAKDLDSAIAKQFEEEAINQQLSEYHYAKNALEGMPGLSFIVTDGDRWTGNAAPDTGMDFFRSQPVYWIADRGATLEQSRSGGDVFGGNIAYGYGVGSSISTGYNLSCYIAFSSGAVNAQNNTWRAAQRQFGNQLMIIAIPLAAALACLIIIIAGAGWKFAGEADKVHFTLIDKPWLDIGLCVLIAFEALIIYGFYSAAQVAWSYSNDRWIIALCAALSVFFSLPLLGWLLSFTKHCKAGKFWRHTFIYAFFRWIWLKLKSFAKSLWAGFPLTMRAIIIGIVLILLFFISYGAQPAGPATILLASAVTVIAVFLLLRYSRKLYLVTRGAKAASEGRYDGPIAVTGGELGSIAVSINNISEGINAAVAERLKSERMRSELITNISHDIRTPLTSLITYSDLLKNEGLDNERAPEYLDILIQKSARLKTLTDDLFEASKAASGNIEVHIENLDLADFIRQVLGELDEKVRASNLDFRLNLPEHAHVRADGRLLWRVVENLLSNVFKYALPGSRVYIDVTIAAAEVAEDRWYRLDIKNISERPLNVDPSELTERFKRGDEARSGDGSGLGLSIAQSFTLSQGGLFALSIDGDLFKTSVSLPKA